VRQGRAAEVSTLVTSLSTAVCCHEEREFETP
jgi:hypothetical protein